MNRSSFWRAIAVVFHCTLGGVCSALGASGGEEADAAFAAQPSSLQELSFTAHDGVPMFGRLVLPESGTPRAILIYVQTAESGTMEMKRQLSPERTFCYYDLYRDKLAAMQIGFCSYEGRGVRMGDTPPRYETIDWDDYNTSTLENKVRDILGAIDAVKGVEGLESVPIILMGASEGTLLAAEAATRAPDSVSALVLYGVMAVNLRETFTYIMSDGEFLRYRSLDTDSDGAITREEWERLIKNAVFAVADLDGDGVFTVQDVRVATSVYLEAIEQEDFDTLQEWARQRAAVSIPDGWFRDHFEHAELWSFLSQLDLPVGCFHGELDRMAPVGAVRALEQKAEEAGRMNLEFYYFEGLDHTLNIGQYFGDGKLPAGHQAIFAFIERVVTESTRRETPETGAPSSFEDGQ